MATGNNDLLNRLRKLLAEAADTSDIRQPWQELFGRQDSVPARAIRAAEAVRDFAGSWAASYTLGHGFLPSTEGTPAPKSGFDSLLGKRGYPEINFVPYNWNTNRYGNKGPSLVGHPVSFEFHGPTYKSIGGSKLTYDVRFDANLISCSANWGDIHGEFDLGVPHWLVVTDPGGGLVDPRTNEYSVPLTDLDEGCSEQEKHKGTARYELFRIIEHRDNDLLLDPSKPLKEYYSNQDPNNVWGKFQSVAILKAKIARLAPIRDLHFRSWAVLPPANAAVGEDQEILSKWTAQAGLSEDHNQGALLPIPKPLPLIAFKPGVAEEDPGSVLQYLEPGQGTFPAFAHNGASGIDLGKTSLGRFRVKVDEKIAAIVSSRSQASKTTILHVSDLSYPEGQKEAFGAEGDDGKFDTLKREGLLGYHEVIKTGESGEHHYLELRFNGIHSPETGQMYKGDPQGIAIIHPTVDFDNRVTLECTLHQPISALYESRYKTDDDDLEAARLTGLIDPKEVGRSLKVHGTNDVPGGGYSGRADRAIPNTVEGVDPGSLLDLGFRMVLYTGNVSIAGKITGINWNKPLTSHELVLDPALPDEAQYVDIDYATGVVKFSHTPVAGGDIAVESGVPVLFAAFVPYSMEGGQRGTGVRVTGGDLHSANLGYPVPHQNDVFSSRKILRGVGVAQAVSQGDDLRLLKDGFTVRDFPQNGIFSLISRTADSPYFDTHEALPSTPLTYEDIKEETDAIVLVGVRWHQPLGVPGTLHVGPDDAVLFRHRGDLSNRYDTTYGNSARTEAVRFAYGDVVYNGDGSVTVTPTAVAGPAEELRAFFPLGDRGDRTSEISRFHFDELTQRWSTDDPPWNKAGHLEPPNQSHEIGLEVSRGRLYTNWEFSPLGGSFYRKVAVKLSQFQYILGKEEAVPDGFIVVANSDSDPDGFNYGMSDCFADNSRAELLSGVIEGCTLSSAFVSGKVAVSDTNEDLRYLFAVKDPHKWGQGWQTHELDRQGIKAANPIEWISVVVPKGAAFYPADLVDAINAVQGEVIARLDYPEGSGVPVVAIDGRQVQALPARPYLASDKMDYPVRIFAGGVNCSVDLRSADSDSRKSWIHFEFLAQHGGAPIDLNNAIELAAYLNEHGLYAQATLDKLKAANFIQDARDPSENPFLRDTLGMDEHQLVWIAHDDPRFPSDLDQTRVALLCGGRGLSYLNNYNQPTEDDSYQYLMSTPSVMAELDDIPEKDGTASLMKLLRGDFSAPTNASGSIPRMGLFWGEKWNKGWAATPYQYPTSASVGRWNNPVLGGMGNVFIGFPHRGTHPLGRFAGSFKINKAMADGSKFVFKMRFPTGQSSDWFNDQSSAGRQEDGLNKINPNVVTFYPEASRSGRTTAPSPGWLGRWAWPHRAPVILPRNEVGVWGGISDVYMTFGTDVHHEDGFNSNIGDRLRSRTSILLEVRPSLIDQWVRPKNVWDDISYGDIVNFSSTVSLSSGRVISKTPSVELDEHGMPLASEDRFRLYVLTKNDFFWQMLEHGGDLTPGAFDAEWRAGWKQITLGNLWPDRAVDTAIVPSPVWGRHAAVSHLVSNRYKSQTQSHNLGETQFVHGTKHPNALSSVLIGGGRVSLLSAQGVTEPTGFALHNLIQGVDTFDELDPANLGQSSVYIESGAWNTTFARGGKYSGQMDHQGFWSSLSTMPGSKNSQGNPYTGHTPASVGGVGGVRISGDAHIWLENIRPLTASSASAFIVDRGPVLSGQLDFPRGHLPDEMTTMVPARGYAVQEATIQIGMTSSDLVAFKGLLAKGSDALEFGDTIFMGTDGNNLKLGKKLYRMGQMGGVEQGPLFMPSLAGSYIHLKNSADAGVVWGDQQGVFRIVAAPMVRLSADVQSLKQSALNDGGNGGVPHNSDIVKNDSYTYGRHSTGRNREAQFVATMTLRIEGFRPIGDPLRIHQSDSSPPNHWESEGLWWTVYRDAGASHVIWTGDVVDPGGSPTGAPSSIRGLTLDPRVVAGKEWLKAELIPLDNTSYHFGSYSDQPIGPPTNHSSGTDNPVFNGQCELLGIHDQIGRFGKHFSRAFFSMSPTDADGEIKTNIPRARMVILSDSAGLVEGFPEGAAHGEFGPGISGKLNWLGYPRRLGPGVMMDGGLGLVHANAFRAAPRNKQTEHLGQLTVWGRGAYPFYNGLKPADVGMELPSTFNTAEFHGEVSVANPQGRMVFESPWAAEGLVANMLTAQYASENHIGPHHYGWKGLKPREAAISAALDTGGLGMMDTLFPYPGSGLVFRTPGTMVYERAFRSLDATGNNPHRKFKAGSHNRSGIPGMGIPFQGEVLLLPQGPPSPGAGKADHFGGFGETPLDIPLYEFVNGCTQSTNMENDDGVMVQVPLTRLQGSPFGINASSCIGGYQSLSYSDATQGPPSHRGQMGTISQSYRHSNSREDIQAFDWAVNGGQQPKWQIRLLDGMVLEDTTNGTFYTVGSVGRDSALPNATSQFGIPGDTRRGMVNGTIVAVGADKYRHVDVAKKATYWVNVLPEVVYDLTGNFDRRTDPFEDLRNGFGDRSDNNHVRRPLFGHNMRVTPNVEFVPVLGPRGVRGGLIPPRVYRKRDASFYKYDSTYYGVDADAYFYDLAHTFQEGDVGKMLYLCGTHTYEHTGWWVIIDVLLPDTLNGDLYAHALDEAKVGSVAALRKYNWSGRQDGTVSWADLDRSADYSGSIPLKYRSPYLTVVADQRTNLADEKGFFGCSSVAVPLADPTYGDLFIEITNRAGSTFPYLLTRAQLLGLGVTNASIAAARLNAQAESNGTQFCNQNGHPAVRFIRWVAQEGVLFCHYRLEMMSSTLRTIALGGAAQMRILWQTRTDGVHGALEEGPDAVGFVQSLGHSLPADRTEGDRNNALPLRMYHPVTKEVDFEDPAARGIRWVFSHPLSEENVGSYIHLTKPSIYRFGEVLQTQDAELTADEELVSKGSWTSGHVQTGDTTGKLDLSTDIFRVNRCPNTSKLVLGGDCEVYHTEFHHINATSAVMDRGYGQAVMYSPLGVHGNWPDTDTVGLNENKLNWPVTYTLQPIAREKIVTVSPTNAKSSVVFARGLGGTDDIPLGPQGVGPMVAGGNTHPQVPEASFVMEPWQLVSRADMTRTDMAKPVNLGMFDNRVEVNNANVDLVTVVSMVESATVDYEKLLDITATLAAQHNVLNEAVVLREADLLEAEQSLFLANSNFAIASATWTKISLAPSGQTAVAKKEQLDELVKKYAYSDAWLTDNQIDSTRLMEEWSSAKATLTEKQALKSDLEHTKAKLLDELTPVQDNIDINEDSFASATKIKAAETAKIEGFNGDLDQNKAEVLGFDANFDFDADYEGDDPTLGALIKKRKQTLVKIKASVAEIRKQDNVALKITASLKVLQAKADSLEWELAATLKRIAEVSVEIQDWKGLVDAAYDGLENGNDAATLAALKSLNWQDVFTVAAYEQWGGDPDIGLKAIRSALLHYQGVANGDIQQFQLEVTAAMNVAGLTKAQNSIDSAEAAQQGALKQVAGAGMMLKEITVERDTVQIAATRAQNRISHLFEIKEYWDELNEAITNNSALSNQVPAQSSYVWTPSGEWWQLYQPAWDKFGPDASAPPPTLRIDLTESFTQAIGPGSGLNTPHPGRFPRGVRLNRLWVNFGSWGRPIVKTERLSKEIPGYIVGLEDGMEPLNAALDEMHITFNLVLEIPGSQARQIHGTDYKHPLASGNAGFPFGGRAPTSATNHNNNSASDPVSSDNRWPGGTIVVPLYINREAGDMMPNVMERFVTAGPKPRYASDSDANANDPVSDWSGGHYEYGFGASSMTAGDPNYYNPATLGPPSQCTGYNGHQTNLNEQLFVNSFNPVVWGGMDFAPFGPDQNHGVFAEPRLARAQASIFARQSRVGGGLRSAFTSGLIPDGSVFSNYDPHSLSAAALTGITICHSAQLKDPPRVNAGSYSSTNRQGGFSSPHGFTVALTPVGDTYQVPSNTPGSHGRLAIESGMTPVYGDDKVARQGRTLESRTLNEPDVLRPCKVGNWLDTIKDRYGIYAPSGSMLPTGSRVFLEISVGPGPGAKDQDPDAYCAAGTWIGSVKLGFDVETADGTAWSADVNVLGDEEG